MDEQLAQLEKEYCPPIDSALFFAIALDFDLTDTNALKSARDALDSIKASAEVEEALGFDPSGSSNVHDSSSSVAHGSQSQPRSWNGERPSSSDDTDVTSATPSTPSLRLDDLRPYNDSGFHESDAGIEDIPNEEKLAILSASFPGLKSFDISHTLTRCGNNLEMAIDELLSQAYLQDACGTDGEREAVPRGVDGFAQNGAFQSRKKGKGKGKKKNKQFASHRRSSSTPAASSEAPLGVANKWTTTENDIEFLVQRTSFSAKVVRSAYHKSSGSLRNTIQNLSEASIDDGPRPSDEELAVIEVHAAELGMNFPMIDKRHVKGIVKMSYPSTASAQKLAQALLTSSTTGERPSGPTDPIIPQYAQLKLDDDADDDTGAGFTTVRRPDRQATSIQRSNDPALRAASYTAARSAAFSQAAAAYRKSRSQPLMGGAAAYYADVGRAASAAAEAHSYAAASALVARQSSSAHIDLHGVDVRSGVRIACERVEEWWAAGSRAEWAREGRVMGGEGGGFRVITGVGRHSVAGRGVLGPAVRKALVAEGWRVGEESGVLTVQGRARK